MEQVTAVWNRVVKQKAVVASKLETARKAIPPPLGFQIVGAPFGFRRPFWVLLGSDAPLLWVVRSGFRPQAPGAPLPLPFWFQKRPLLVRSGQPQPPQPFNKGQSFRSPG